MPPLTEGRPTPATLRTLPSGSKARKQKTDQDERETKPWMETPIQSLKAAS
jgi:hypothetical protein